MTTDHGSRGHARWSASSTERLWNCAGALSLSSVAPPSRGSIHASRGTAAHQISERALRFGTDARSYLGTVEQTNEGPVEIDEELADSASTYVDYCRERMDCYRQETADEPLRWIEENFSLAAINPPFQAGGTGDFIMYFPRWFLLEVVDLKNGKGVVEAKGNKQGRTYGLGAILKHSDLAVERVKVTIVQPRAPHRDGRIRSDDFTVGELVDWSQQLLAAMRRAAEAEDEYQLVAGALMLEAWGKKYLQPGKCKFCPAEAFCPAIRRKAEFDAGLWFEPETKEAVIRNQPREMSPEAIAEVLDYADSYESWLNAVRAYAHSLAERDQAPPGYILVEKHGQRRWKLGEAETVAKLQSDHALTDEQVYGKPKLKSPAQIEGILGPKRKLEIEGMWEKPTTGTNLVRQDKTEREPVASLAERYFEPPQD